MTKFVLNLSMLLQYTYDYIYISCLLLLLYTIYVYVYTMFDVNLVKSSREVPLRRTRVRVTGVAVPPSRIVPVSVRGTARARSVPRGRLFALLRSMRAGGTRAVIAEMMHTNKFYIL